MARTSTFTSSPLVDNMSRLPATTTIIHRSIVGHIYSVIWILLLVCHTVSADFTVSACFNQTEKTLTLTCPQGHMVKVTRVIQGYNAGRDCVYRADDCVYEIKDGSYPCVGRQSCQINLPSGDVGESLHQCDAHATYLHLEYDCVPEVDVYDICTTNHLPLQSAYISTPRYPNNYPLLQNCTLYVETPYPSQRLRLYAVDLTLEGDSEHGCRDSLYIFDRHRGYTLCSMVARKELMVTMENYLELKFISDRSNKQKGFWLYYEAEPYISTTTPRPTTTPPTTTTSTSVPTSSNGSPVVIGAVTKATKPTESKTKNDESLGFPTGLLVGVLLGALLCAVIILLTIIILRRRRLKMTQSPSCASNVAIMASQLSKPTPPQTLHNTLQPENEYSLQMQHSKLKTENEQSLTKPDNKGSLPQQQHHMELDIDYDKAYNKGAFINKNMHTGEEVLFC